MTPAPPLTEEDLAPLREVVAGLSGRDVLLCLVMLLERMLPAGTIKAEIATATGALVSIERTHRPAGSDA